jgi:hypothetical protein
MQISGEFGTELLLRYTEEQLIRDLERRRIVNERVAEIRAEKRRARAAMRGRLADFVAGNTVGMPAAPPRRTAGVSGAHAVHR